MLSNQLQRLIQANVNDFQLESQLNGLNSQKMVLDIWRKNDEG